MLKKNKKKTTTIKEQCTESKTNNSDTRAYKHIENKNFV